ncbi:NAD(P)/FAD-dependent oxidoreductase [Pseudodonghicola flavimaris]|uniref:FAD-binding oxidoreductase n=1 Tax=Pseudodonghicola flavimaris TaxID=3050036 RepID=A0ABT7F0N3_9RHOB|nr:FAD-binding oxidoreductase [Pseudodonghicola flavimaris]MDK3018166.1 FAD-binding oxidoreductase [Pseudodonghicola flavimaris]
MIQNEAPVIANSLWTATAHPAPRSTPLTGPEEADVAIVGGGFTGLSAALHLAEAGISVVLLEAEEPGWGASGRNGGQVNPGLKDAPDAVEAQFGAEAGRRMIRMSGGAGQLVFDLVRRHGIECDAQEVGWIRAAHTPKSRAEFHDLADQWQRRGAAVEPLGAQDVTDLIGTPVYCGGLIDRRGGNLHPLNYALGLAAAARRAGARIYGQSRATGLERAGAGFRLSTAGGQVTARRVLLCTNGYTDGLRPPLARSVIPVRSVQVATAPLGDLGETILPGRQAPSDSRRLLLYFRRDAAGRFIMGGRGAFSDGGTARQLAALRQVSEQMFPQLKGVSWDYAWGGFVAATADHYPHLHLLEDGLMAGLGYNGRGVAMGTAMGKVMADWVLGTPVSALDFPVTPVKPVPFHGFRKLGVTAAIGGYRLLDALGL